MQRNRSLIILDGYNNKSNCDLIKINISHCFSHLSRLGVARVFGKEHKNVIQSIENLECPKDFRLLNFEESNYKNQQGKSQPMYELTRDGFTLLAFGFTGAYFSFEGDLGGEDVSVFCELSGDP
jgi:Rha family phage regulatory protein